MRFIDTELMEKYLQGKADKEEADKVQTWLLLNLKSPSSDGEFEEIMDRVPELKDDKRKERVLSNLKTVIDTDIRQKSYMRRQKRKGAFIYAMLTSLCVALGIMTYSYVNVKNDSRKIVSWTEISASYGEIKDVILPDGSHIWLHNGTRLVYPDSFSGGKRQVFASGEIYAEIQSDKDCPFIVSADNANVIVKGTKFNMRSYPEMDNITVTLVEGDVDLEYVTPWGKDAVDIMKGETVSVNLKNGGIDKYRYEEYVSWKDRRAMYFNDKTLAEIAEELEHEFNVRIVLPDASLAYSRHFASFVNNESVVDILKALCGASCQITEKDSTIYITPIN